MSPPAARDSERRAGIVAAAGFFLLSVYFTGLFPPFGNPNELSRLEAVYCFVELGTFSKALGVVGGYVAGSNDLRNYALNKSRTWLLSGSHPPATTAACIAAIDVLETEPRHVKKLWRNTRYFKKQLVSMGFDIGHSETPITPVMLGDSAVAKRFSGRLFEEGVFALPIVFPMVAKDRARIRNIVTAGLRRKDLDDALSAYEKIGKELKVIA